MKLVLRHSLVILTLALAQISQASSPTIHSSFESGAYDGWSFKISDGDSSLNAHPRPAASAEHRSARIQIWDVVGTVQEPAWMVNSDSDPERDFNLTPYNAAPPSKQWSGTTPASGNDLLSLGVTMRDDANSASYGFFDPIFNASTTLPVPEPSALSFFAIAAAFMASRRSKESSKST